MYFQTETRAVAERKREMKQLHYCNAGAPSAILRDAAMAAMYVFSVGTRGGGHATLQTRRQRVTLQIVLVLELFCRPPRGLCSFGQSFSTGSRPWLQTIALWAQGRLATCPPQGFCRRGRPYMLKRQARNRFRL